MKNKVTVSVAGQDYTLVTTDEPEYVKRVAAHVDEQMRGIADAGRTSILDSAVLAALNIADEFLKEQAAEENLRGQLKQVLEESAKLKLELAEANRKIFGLTNRK